MQANSSGTQGAEWNSAIQKIYEFAQQLSLEEKALLIKALIDNSKMSLSLRVELTGSSKMTVLSFNLDSNEKIAQTLEVAASKLEQNAVQKDTQKKGQRSSSSTNNADK